MPLAYSEVTASVTSRTRNVCEAHNGVLWMPSSGHASIGMLDLSTHAFSELTSGVTSKVRNRGFLVGDELFLPANNDATCGVVNTSTVAYSEFAVSIAQNWFSAVAIDSSGIIHQFISWTSGTFRHQMINTATKTATWETLSLPSGYTNIVFANPWESSPGVIHMYGTSTSPSARLLIRFDVATKVMTQSAWPGAGNSPQGPVQIGGDQWFWESVNGQVIGEPVGTVYSSLSLVGSRFTGEAVGTTVWWPQSGGGRLSEFDTATGSLTDHTTIGMGSRTRQTSALVPTAPLLARLYVPSSGHASIGYIDDIPLPVVRRGGTRGLGLVRGRGRF